jgi:hypothetical protein
MTGEVNLAAAAERNVEGGSTMEGEGLKILSGPRGSCVGCCFSY